MKPADVKSISYINSSEKIMVKILNLKLEIRLEYQNINFFLQKSMFQIGLKTRLWLKKKIKNTLLWIYVISDLNEEECVGTFYRKELGKSNQKEFRV